MCRWFFKEAKGFDIIGAGAKDTEWIGPIYGAKQNYAYKPILADKASTSKNLTGP